MTMREAVSALNRFGMGAKPGTLATLGEPRAWLLGQIRGQVAPAAFSGLPSSLEYLRHEEGLLQQRKESRRSGDGSRDGQMKIGRVYRQSLLQELGKRYQVAVASEHGFHERLVRFWSNHFAVSVDKRQAALYAAPMEREAIRPHVAGNFSTLLLAVETHPAMLRYLDNVRSVGVDSMLAERIRRRSQMRRSDQPVRDPGLNENLAREILELHTLGVAGGYAQADVGELARAITGWGVPMPQDWKRGTPGSAFMFRPAAHEGGTRLVLGRRYADQGVDQGRAILVDLAQHPATARHLCLKLARHFVSDDPPVLLVERMAKVWRDTGGDLAAVYRTLIESPESWASTATKFKTPEDFVVSALRAVGDPLVDGARQVVELLTRMGQPPFSPRSPAGFADDALEWSGADALWKRVQAAQSLAEAAPETRIDALSVSHAVFADQLDAATLAAIGRAESMRDALAVLIASPAFQWRT